MAHGASNQTSARMSAARCCRICCHLRTACCCARPLRLVGEAAGSQTSDAYCLLELASPTPDGAAVRRYGRMESSQIEYVPAPPTATAPNELRGPLKTTVDEGSIRWLAGLRTAHASQPPLMAVSSSTTVRASAAVSEVASELLPSVSADAPLMEAGLDSLGTVEFRNRLVARLGNAVELPETLLFDFPTLRQVELHLNSAMQLQSASAPPAIAAPPMGLDAALLTQLLGSVQGPTPAAPSTTQPRSCGVDVMAMVREVASGCCRAFLPTRR